MNIPEKVQKLIDSPSDEDRILGYELAINYIGREGVHRLLQDLHNYCWENLPVNEFVKIWTKGINYFYQDNHRQKQLEAR